LERRRSINKEGGLVPRAARDAVSQKGSRDRTGQIRERRECADRIASKSIGSIVNACITARTSRIIRISSVKILSKWTKRFGKTLRIAQLAFATTLSASLLHLSEAPVLDDLHD